MSKYNEYEKIKQLVEKQQGKVGAFQEINYGIQFDVTIGELSSKVRVYESKKKGITVDLSQVKHDELKEVILNINSSTIANSGQTSYASDEMTNALIGVDESGKGDYFGPLVIGAVYADETMKHQLIKLGVMDSKKLSDEQINKLAESIKVLCDYEVLVIDNLTYNRLYEKIQNLNVLLAKGHAKVIQTLVNKTGCNLALSDQFGDAKLIETALKRYEISLKLEQRPKAETNVVVAAASIIARDAFVKEIETMGKKYGQEFPKGASQLTVTAGKRYVQRFGKSGLMDVAKLHFKTTEQL